MKTTNYLLLAIASGFMIMFSCDDILEKNISSEFVTLQAPLESDTSMTVNETFLWDNVSGARSYELTIFLMKNNNPVEMILDTVITKNQFKTTLDMGNYQWCVKGVNAGYETKLSCRTLTIVEKNISTDVIVLQTPAASLTTTTVTQTFSWESLQEATSYQFKIVKPTMANPTSVVLDTLLSQNALKLKLDTGSYEWCVKGINSVYKTQLSCRSLSIKK